MFGIRILVYLLGIALVVWILMRLVGGSRPQVTRKPGERAVDDMVRCHRCGVFIPRSESVRGGGHDYCCTRHRDEDREQHDGH
ncbi:MAG TPA: hypothetical protein ENK05_11090 [Gammaproteobacteria bacterium]|nr:hypothetical protein [Gammaproteobacteria bacterium]